MDIYGNEMSVDDFDLN